MLIIINIDMIINKKVGKVYRLFISQVTFSHKNFFEQKRQPDVIGLQI